MYGTKDGKQLSDTEVILSPQKPVNITDEEFRGQTTAGKAYNFLRPIQIYQNKATGEWDEQDFMLPMVGDKLVGSIMAGGAAPWSDVISAGYVPNSIILGIIDGLSNKKAKKEAEDDIEKLRGTYPKPEDIMKALGEDADKAVVRPEDLQFGGKSLKDALDGMNNYMKKLDGQVKYMGEQAGIIRNWINYHEKYHNKPKTQKKQTSYNKKRFDLQSYIQ